LFEEVEKLKKKIEEERAEKVRSISKLKMEINPKILQGETHPPDTDIGKLKEKVRNLERK
jgi:predicted Zn-dependent peptidase